MSKQYDYQVIEDNGGNISIFFFDEDGNVILGVEGMEGEDIDVNLITLNEIFYRYGALEAPQTDYDYQTSFEFGWAVIADQDGIYPDRAGAAGRILLGLNEAE